MSISVAHGNTSAVYDPSADRAIHSLHYSYDGRALPGSRQASIRPLAKQGDRWFWTAFDSERVLINEDGWVTREGGGEADEYQGVSLIGFGHNGELDLTENGTAITFGFSTAASHKGTSETTRNTGVDNWRVVICKARSKTPIIAGLPLVPSCKKHIEKRTYLQDASADQVATSLTLEKVMKKHGTAVRHSDSSIARTAPQHPCRGQPSRRRTPIVTRYS